MNITFKYVLDEPVRTPFGEPGKVDMLGVSKVGVMYYVKTAGGGNWFKESEIAEG